MKIAYVWLKRLKIKLRVIYDVLFFLILLMSSKICNNASKGFSHYFSKKKEKKRKTVDWKGKNLKVKQKHFLLNDYVVKLKVTSSF